MPRGRRKIPTADIPPLSPNFSRERPTPTVAENPTPTTASLPTTTSPHLHNSPAAQPNTIHPHQERPILSKPVANSKEPKNWQFPHAMDKEFATFIDHGCVLDWQGYPLYPNGSTTFVRPAGTSITNFGAVGFSRTCSNGAKSLTADWKVV